MFNVFVSYSRADSAQAAVLDAWLTSQGLRTFLDRRELGAGQLWLPDLERAIETEAAALIVLCGPGGLGNTQQYEAQLGLTRKAREPDFPVVPVLLPCTPDWRWPRGFLSLQTWVSFATTRDVREDPAALQRLAAAVRRESAEADAVRGLVCPYKGLDAFQEEDGGLFFGRAVETEALHATIAEHRFAAVVGRSGSGKSSLARAGLLPRLRAGAQAAGRREVWDSLVLRPGQEPLVALAGALSPPLPGEDEAARYLRLRGLAAGLRTEDPDVLSGLLRHRLAQSRLAVDRLLILLDQGEELFARPLHLLGDAAAQRRFDADAEYLIALLLKAVSQGSASLVLTMRSDFFDPLQSSAFGDMLKGSLVTLRRVGDLRACIEGPAEAVGLRFAPPGLVDRILEEVGTDESNLPLLQHALKRTWEGRDGAVLSANAYIRSGGVEQAINRAAEACFAGLRADEKLAARRLFLRLVRPGEGATHVRVAAPQPEDPLERAVMERFADPKQRLLFADVRNGAKVVEVAHEALIRGWPTLLEWVGESRERLRARADVLRWRESFTHELEPIPPGALLQRAQDLVRNPGDVPVDDISAYIADSVAAADRQAMEESLRAADREKLRADLAEQKAELASSTARTSRKMARIYGFGALGLIMALFVVVGQLLLITKRQIVSENYISAATESARETVRAWAADHATLDLIPGENLRPILMRSDAVYRRLLEARPNDPDLRLLRGEGLLLSAQAMETRAPLNDTLDIYTQAVDLLPIRIFSMHDNLRMFSRNDALRTAAIRLSGRQGILGNHSDALRVQELFLAFLEQPRSTRSGEYQPNWSAVSDAVYIRIHREETLYNLGRPDEAMESAQESILRTEGAEPHRYATAVQRNQRGVDRVRVEWAFRKHYLRIRLSYWQRIAGDNSEALATYRKAASALESFTANGQPSPEWNLVRQPLRDFLQSTGSEADWTFSLMRSLIGSGDIWRGRQSPFNNIWDPVLALSAYKSALDLAETSLSTDPFSAIKRRNAAIIHERLGDVYSTNWPERTPMDMAAALTHYRAALALATSTGGTAEGGFDWNLWRVAVQSKLGSTLVALRQPSAALPIFQDALEAIEARGPLGSRSTPWLIEGAAISRATVALLLDRQDCAAASSEARRTTNLLEALIRHLPQVAWVRRDLNLASTARERVAACLREAGRAL